MTLITDFIIKKKYPNFGRIFIKVVKCKLDIIIPLNVFLSMLWKMDVSWRKEYKVATWSCHIHGYNGNNHIITIEKVMCIMHCRKYHLHDCNRKSDLYNFNIVTHIFAAEIFTCISVAETSNCIIATETVTFITATKRSTNLSVAESTTNIIAIETQNLNNCNRNWHLHNCCRKRQLHSSNRNCHLQDWLQKLSLAEMVTVRDRFSYNKEIEWMSKDQN